MKWPGSKAEANVPDIEPCPNCQCRGRLSFKEWRVDEKSELIGDAHCGNCGADLEVIQQRRSRKKQGSLAGYVFGGTIEEARDWRPSLLSHAICPQCGHDGLRWRRTRDRRLTPDGFEQPHCEGCGRDVPVDVAAEIFLGQVKTNRAGVVPEGLRNLEAVVAFIRDLYSPRPAALN